MDEFSKAILGIFKDVRGFLLGILCGLAMVRMAYEGFKYKGADESERAEIKRSIRNTFYFIVGTPFVIYLIPYIWGKLKTVLDTL